MRTVAKRYGIDFERAVKAAHDTGTEHRRLSFQSGMADPDMYASSDVWSENDFIRAAGVEYDHVTQLANAIDDGDDELYSLMSSVHDEYIKRFEGRGN